MREVGTLDAHATRSVRSVDMVEKGAEVHALLATAEPVARLDAAQQSRLETV